MKENSKQAQGMWGNCTAAEAGPAFVDAASYVSPEAFDRERAAIFSKLWMMVAREEELPEPRTFIRVAIPPLETEAIITRGENGQIQAFHNACAHRGVALVQKCSGSARAFVCPYHAWTFTLDGSLKAVPGRENFPELDLSKTRLKPIACQTWNGFIFLNFSESPDQTLEEYLGDIGIRLQGLPFHGYPHVIELRQEVAANWKMLVDASSEGYHVTVLHKQSLSSQMTTPENPLNYFYDPIYSAPHSSSTTQANTEWRPTHTVAKFIAANTQIPSSEPSADSGADQGVTSFSNHPAINRIGLPAFAAESTQIFPFSVIQMLPNRYIWFQYYPLAHNRTKIVTRLYMPTAPKSYREHFLESCLIAYSRDIMTEDSVVTALQQKGLESGGLDQVILGENEFLLRFFHKMVRNYTADSAA